MRHKKFCLTAMTGMLMSGAVMIGTVITGIVLPLPTASAQSDIPEAKKSVVAIDLQLNRIRQSPLYEKANLKKFVERAQREGNMDDIDFEKVDRVIASASAPASIGVFDEMGPGSDVPLEFFVRITFNDESAATELYEEFKRKSKAVEVNGKTYLRPKTDDDPQNISISQVDASTIEVGTDGYIMQQGRNFRTDRLSAAWQSMPDHAIRLAVDLKSAEAFVTEGVGMAKQQVPPEAHMFVDLIAKMSTLQLAVDMDADPIVALAMEGKDDESTGTLQNGVDGLLGLARFGGKQGVAQLAEMDPKLGKVAGALLESLKTTRDGNNISLNIPRPEGFNEAVIAGMERAQAGAAKANKMNNMRMLALSIHNYHDTFRQFPFTARDGTSEDISWRAQVLPFVEEAALYDQMDMSKAHSEDPNSQFGMQMPAVFGDGDTSSNICSITHEETPKNFADIRDGTSNTIMLIQTKESYPWMQPGGVTVDQAVELISGLPDGEAAVVAFYDGAVRELGNTVPADTLRALMTPNGGEVITGDF